jgi:hypothetical protein
LWVQIANFICFVDSALMDQKNYDEYQEFVNSIEKLSKLLNDTDFEDFKNKLYTAKDTIDPPHYPSLRPKNLRTTDTSYTDKSPKEKYEENCKNFNNWMKKGDLFRYLTIPINELIVELQAKKLIAPPPSPIKITEQKDELESLTSKNKFETLQTDFKALQERYNALFGASCLLCSVVVLTILYRRYHQESNIDQVSDSYSDSFTGQRNNQSCSAKEKHPHQIPTEFIEVDTSRARSDDTRIRFTNSRIISPTHSQKINTTSYEKILQQHFRTTSSSNFSFDHNTTTYTGRSRA